MIRYSVDNNKDKHTLYTSHVTSYQLDCLESVAEECAEDYESNHDGWEDSWPIELSLFDENDELMGRFRVDREYNPVFSATSIKEKS